MLSAVQQDMIVRALARNEAISAFIAQNWLRVTYRRLLYGGYKRDDGSLAPPHTKALAFHAAMNDPRVLTGVIAGGRRSGKTFTGLSEFCSWIIGERPWDGSKTAPLMSGRRWLIVAPNFSTAVPDVIEPYLEMRIGHLIVDRVRNQQKALVTAILKNGDIVRINSYEQFLKVSREQTNVFQSGHFDGVICDEPPPRDVWLGIKRGLVTGQSRGWGKAIICGTPDKEEFGWVFDDLYSHAGNVGGHDDSIYAAQFSIYDNPENTPAAIERMKSGLTEEEQEAIIHGRWRHLTGRIYKGFDETLHVQHWDPLVLPDGTASDWPIIMCVDPATRRPWAAVWAAVAPDGSLHVVREYPSDPFESMHSCNNDFKDYARIFRDIEAEFPTKGDGHWSGSSRVLWRIMDPNAGPSRTPGGGELSIAEFMGKHGFTFDTDIEDGLQIGHTRVRGLLAIPDKDQPVTPLNRPALFIHSTDDHPCRNVIWSLNHYVYDEYHTQGKALREDPRATGKDHADCVRYIAMRMPRYVSWRSIGQWTARSKGALRERIRGSRW
jgi:hypothetical protein